MHNFDTEFLKEEQKEQKIISETGARIKLLIKQSGISQRELSHAVDIPPNVISYYCGGKRQPGVKDLVNLADYFHTSVDYLLGRTEMKTPPEEMKTIIDDIGFNEDVILYLKELEPHMKTILRDLMLVKENNVSVNHEDHYMFSELLLAMYDYLDAISNPDKRDSYLTNFCLTAEQSWMIQKILSNHYGDDSKTKLIIEETRFDFRLMDIGKYFCSIIEKLSENTKDK